MPITRVNAQHPPDDTVVGRLASPQSPTPLRRAPEFGSIRYLTERLGRREGVGSRELSFVPGGVRGGEYTFAVGSAGMTTLVMQTVLPPLMCAEQGSTITFEGGTHNPMCPPFEFLEHAFLPIVHRMGPRVDASRERHGSFPAGGGRWVVRDGRAQPARADEH